MDGSRIADLSYTDLAALDRRHLVAILPVGATEAHGPHLPLSTDGVIADGMAEAGWRRLREAGQGALILPRLDYTAAPFAQAFPGTVSVRPETVTALIEDIGTALARDGWRGLALANAHLDPTHLASLYAARDALEDRGDLIVAFPDVTRRPWAPRLTEEFKSGACHAGRYEGSIVMAQRPDLVHEQRRLGLPANPASLSEAIRHGLVSFEAAGGPQAYFGAPAEASAEEGRRTLETLGDILAEAVLARLAERS